LWHRELSGTVLAPLAGCSFSRRSCSGGSGHSGGSGGSGGNGGSGCSGGRGGRGGSGGSGCSGFRGGRSIGGGGGGGTHSREEQVTLADHLVMITLQLLVRSLEALPF
tara:strand:- start:418 stop:741 length:324 start_codon:yes stop_codon:yes gene_type:complete